jgi:hypothetical protein
MRQHNAGGNSDGRNCWNTARERNRLKARYTIRQRVASSSSSSAFATTAVHVHEDKRRNTMILSVLHRIVQGDRSFFSLHFLAENAALLVTPLPTELLVLPDGKLYLEQKIASRFGQQMVCHVLHICSAVQETCTFYEYAAWLGRYHIISALLLGGVNPCRRGATKRQLWGTLDYYVSDEVYWKDAIFALGGQVLQQFFNGVPLSLSSYIVKRVVDMRLLAATTTVDGTDCIDGDSAYGTSNEVCYLCHHSVPFNVRLRMESCNHLFCEPCLWRNVLDSLDHREGDVVQCPRCGAAPPRDDANEFLRTSGGEHEKLVRNDSPVTRFHMSLQKFLAMPSDLLSLKQSTTKRGRIQERDALSSSWSEAVRPSLGSCQAVRRDRFFGYVDKGLYHYVKGCLVAGVDQRLRNEYGQTSLFVATWHGHTRLVQLLLEFGSDLVLATSHGGFTALEVARANGRPEIVRLLVQYSGDEMADDPADGNMHRIETTSLDNLPPLCDLTTLIDQSADHPGAGSFLIDDCISEYVVNKLIDLWGKLPVEDSSIKKKKKGIPCSVRSYFCDVKFWISSLLQSVLRTLIHGEFNDDDPVSVFPHMRFLCYEEQTAVLAPHVDLCRVNYATGKRSTHSFLLYLSDCRVGGETALLQDLSGEGRNVVLARVQPKRARLLLFPHACPHEGEAVVDVPKLLIRGEVYLNLLSKVY